MKKKLYIKLNIKHSKKVGLLRVKINAIFKFYSFGKSTYITLTDFLSNKKCEI